MRTTEEESRLFKLFDQRFVEMWEMSGPGLGLKIALFVPEWYCHLRSMGLGVVDHSKVKRVGGSLYIPDPATARDFGGGLMAVEVPRDFALRALSLGCLP